MTQDYKLRLYGNAVRVLDNFTKVYYNTYSKPNSDEYIIGYHDGLAYAKSLLTLEDAKFIDYDGWATKVKEGRL